MLAVHQEETEDSALEVGAFLHGQLKEWSNYIIKDVIIRWTETCSLYTERWEATQHLSTGVHR